LIHKCVVLYLCRDRREHGGKSVEVKRKFGKTPHGSRREQQGANKASVDMMEHEFMSAANWLFQDSNAGGFYAIDKSDIYGRRWYKTEDGIEFLRRSKTFSPSLLPPPPLRSSHLAPSLLASPPLSLSKAKSLATYKFSQRNIPASLIMRSSSMLEPNFLIGPVLTPAIAGRKT
jgi:hypothetical protein